MDEVVQRLKALEAVLGRGNMQSTSVQQKDAVFNGRLKLLNRDTLPATCATGEMCIVSGVSYTCSAPDTWTSSGGSGSPGSPDTSVQFNDGGNFGGDTNLLWNKTTDTLLVKGTTFGSLAVTGTTITGVDTSETGSYITIQGGNGDSGGPPDGGPKGGYIHIIAGDGDGDNGGDIEITAGSDVSDDGGPVTITAGSGGGTGGDVDITAGTGDGGGGNINIRSGGGSTDIAGDIFLNTDGGVSKHGDIWLNMSSSSVLGEEGSLLNLGSPASAGGLTMNKTFKLTTTDATPLKQKIFTLAEDKAVTVKMSIAALDSSGGNSAGYIRYATYKRQVSGSATLVGSISSPFTVENDAAWDATFTISSNDIQVQVTGAAATSIYWACSFEVTGWNQFFET